MNIVGSSTSSHQPWNKDKPVGQKAPLRLHDIWAVRVRVQLRAAVRDLALFNLAIDSKLRACDLVKLRVRDVAHGERISHRAIVLQQKTHSPVQFEITEPTRLAVSAWITRAALPSDSYLFPSRLRDSPHLSTRQYARIVDNWIAEIGLDVAAYGTHTMRRTKEPSRRAIAAWTQPTGEYGALSWHRGRRCAGDVGANRSLRMLDPDGGHLKGVAVRPVADGRSRPQASR